jgi:hypothetical protein
MVANGWTDDEVQDYISQQIKESRGDRFSQYVEKRMPELLAEYQTQNQDNKTDGDTSPKTKPIPKPKPASADDDNNPAPKRRSSYWGDLEDEL